MSPDPWKSSPSADRVAPRDCIAEARDTLNRAWCADTTDQAALVLYLRGALDWMRRALEQMDPQPDLDPARKRPPDAEAQRKAIITTVARLREAERRGHIPLGFQGQ